MLFCIVPDSGLCVPEHTVHLGEQLNLSADRGENAAHYNHDLIQVRCQTNIFLGLGKVQLNPFQVFSTFLPL